MAATHYDVNMGSFPTFAALSTNVCCWTAERDPSCHSLHVLKLRCTCEVI